MIKVNSYDTFNFVLNDISAVDSSVPRGCAGLEPHYANAFPFIEFFEKEVGCLYGADGSLDDSVAAGQRICCCSDTECATEPPPPVVECVTDFEGGEWALVRRTDGTTWHEATDDLKGTDVYGTYGTETSDSMFSIAWSDWTTSGELLLMTGVV